MSDRKESSASNEKPSHYVAIGASAGGLEPLQKLVNNLPRNSGCAYIIVQHLSPDFKSMMDELLGRETNIPILKAAEGQILAADAIYLAPPRTHIQLQDGVINLLDPEQAFGGNFPIDSCFHALADDQGKKSIAVVLSGTGSDGSRGIQAIKAAGGLVVAQEPSAAAFDGMPNKAIDTGKVDIIAEAADIPSRIFQYINNPVIASEDHTLGMTEADTAKGLHGIFDLLQETCDIDFTHYKNNTVTRRIGRRMGVCGSASLQEYHALLQRDERELSILSKDMLIGVTRFFRDADHFAVLENTVVPSILDNTKPREPIRVWVAGCSTGEEAYSVAILFDEAIRKRGETREIKIFATDVDADAVFDASLGHYPASIDTDVSQERLKRYFVAEENFYTVNQNLRKKVLFANQNLLKDPPFSNCQLALCRNVLIYFQAEAQRRVLTMLHFALKRNGYLFLGASESLGELQGYFDIVEDRSRVYRKCTSTKLLVQSISSQHASEHVKDAHRGAQELTSNGFNRLLGSYKSKSRAPQYLPVYEKLITDYAPGTIVLDTELSVLHVFGNVEAYTSSLRSGRFTSNIKDMLVDGLEIPVSTALYRAQTQKQDVHYDNVAFVSANKEQLSVDLTVMYISTSDMIAPHYAIVFGNEKVIDENDKRQATDYSSSENNQQLIRDLEESLRKKQEDLQVTVEELQTTNEELQSSNEELMSANEELQSTNEELQSVNEELHSVNSEYQENIQQLTQANQDIYNIINSANISFVFLDESMTVRRFSLNGADIIHLMPGDIGRPFHHISHELIYDNILHDITRSINEGVSTEAECLTKNNDRVLVKVSPYLNERKVAMGSVVSFTDISDMVSLKGELTASWQELQSTLRTSLLSDEETVRVLVVDDDELDREAIRRAIGNIRDSSDRYELFSADSVEAAQEQLRAREFDVCILDFALGEHTGLDLVRELKVKDSAPAFIVLSGVLSEDKVHQAVMLGVFEVLDKKDISPALLDHSMRYALRHRKTESFLQGSVSRIRSR